MTALVGRALAMAVHPICRQADPDQAGMSIGAVEAALGQAGVEIAGAKPRQVLGTALNNSQDLFEWDASAHGLWRWIEPLEAKGAALSGQALAEEAYRLAMRHDPHQTGIHYRAMTTLLHGDGVQIRGTNHGKTVFAALNAADRWFEWVSSGTFRWKL